MHNPRKICEVLYKRHNRYVHNFELWTEETKSPLVPKKIHLLPAGESFEGRDGRVFESAEIEELLAAFAANAMDLPVDIEHSTEIKAPMGDAAPAVGWIKSISADADGIWGEVEWNAAGEDLISSKQYRYISPVFEVESKTKRVKKLISAALTNRPNLHLKSLNSRDEKETTFECEQSHDETKDIMEVTKMEVEKVTPAEVMTEANAVEVTATAGDKFLMVPRHEVEVHQKRAAEAEAVNDMLRAKLLNIETNHEIEKALASSKITPASESYYREMCSTEDGLARFKNFIADQKPSVAKDFSEVLKKLNPERGIELNAQDRAFCAKYGFSEDEYMKTKVEEAKRNRGRIEQ